MKQATKTPKKAGAGDRRGQRRLSREEAQLWGEVTGDVDRLAGTNAPGPVAPDGAPRKESAPPVSRRAGRAAAPPPPAPLPDLRHDAQPGLDKRTAARLKRGQLPIEGRIDLHGLTQDEAHRALAAFLAASRDAGRRSLLVITGKGLGRDGSVGVLRAAVPRWLNEAGNRRHVLAFHQARPRDGGEGALYILLKQNRK